ncbi:hypothetical protein HED60_15005 [Planctomycetales bacterium ZRK34]|nr:hypothetical protein HED60_15005 [Planctomycetales bacterium ZRK34]
MPTPIKEQIAALLLSTVAGVTEANGYNYTLSAMRPTRYGKFSIEDKLALVQQLDPEEDPENSVAGDPGAKAWIQPFIVDVFAVPSEKSTDAIDTQLNVMCADVEKALMAALPPFGTAFDELAFNASIAPPEFMAKADGSCEWVRVIVEISYRTDETDPYTAR